jgi:hypothetical protein
VEACRRALFLSASDAAPEDQPDTYLGRGILNVPAMLDSKLARDIRKDIRDGKVPKQPVDKIDSVLGRKLLDMGAPATEEERMYVVEMAQVIVRLKNRGLFRDPDGLNRLRHLLKDEVDVSVALREKIAAAVTQESRLRTRKSRGKARRVR